MIYTGVSGIGKLPQPNYFINFNKKFIIYTSMVSTVNPYNKITKTKHISSILNFCFFSKQNGNRDHIERNITLE